MNARSIRINEREPGRFELVVINHDERKTYAQGPALNCASPEQAYQYAHKTLPNKILAGARWEFRSVHGVYADLDIAKLGWLTA